MPTFTAPDGTRLAAHLAEGGGEDGDPVVCLPGGPADSAYLGDLGGLAAHRALLRLDLRGTGASALPEDPASYRCDRLVDDVEALRTHLGLGEIDLLAHSGGANLAVQYAARYPRRVRRLALIGPGTRAAGVEVTGEARRAVALSRAHEPWFPEAFAAFEAVAAGTGGDWEAVAPFFWGRWDETTRKLHAESQPCNGEAVRGYGSDGAFDPDATRAALASLTAPVLLLAGEYDLNSPPAAVAELAALFPDATLVVQPGAGHYPWHDDADRFVATAAAFLAAQLF
ncbi:alpha/beta fold hydrolase [Actinomycetota bacterium Odt1-20B]